MIGAAEPVPVGRVHPIYLEGKLLPVSVPIATELGLHEGQVIQAMVRSEGSALNLKLKGQAIDIPTALAGQFAAGRSVWLRVMPNSEGGLGLLPLAQPNLASDYAPLVSRITEMLYRPDDHSLHNVLEQNQIPSLLKQLGRSDLLAQWQGMQLEMSKLRPEMLRQALQAAMGLEVWMQRNRPIPGADTKSFFKQLLNALDDFDPEHHIDRSPLKNAIDTLESRQIQAIQAQTQQEVMFTWTVPFGDSSPATLVFKRAPSREGQPPVFTVNVHSKSQDLGPVWLQTRLTGSDQVDLTMWAQRENIALTAKDRQAELRAQLVEAGLSLQGFQVIHGSRPASPSEWTPSGRGLVVDIVA